MIGETTGRSSIPRHGHRCHDIRTLKHKKSLHSIRKHRVNVILVRATRSRRVGIIKRRSGLEAEAERSQLVLGFRHNDHAISGWFSRYPLDSIYDFSVLEQSSSKLPSTSIAKLWCPGTTLGSEGKLYQHKRSALPFAGHEPVLPNPHVRRRWWWCTCSRVVDRCRPVPSRIGTMYVLRRIR